MKAAIVGSGLLHHFLWLFGEVKSGTLRLCESTTPRMPVPEGVQLHRTSENLVVGYCTDARIPKQDWVRLGLPSIQLKKD